MLHRLASLLLIVLLEPAAAQQSKLPLKIADATAQQWVSGAPGGRAGTEYKVKLYIRTAAKFQFKNIWLGSVNVPFEQQSYSNSKRIHPPDSLLLDFNIITGEKIETTDAKRLPIDYKGAALIEAVIDGKARYFIVKSFRQLKKLQGQ